MRQTLNVSLAVQLESKNESEADKFLLELERPPAGWARRGPRRDFVAPELLSLMDGGG